MGLDADQRRRTEEWFPGHVVVADLGWGLVDTTVLHLRTTGSGDVIVKAGGPDNHHLTREIAARQRWCGPWLATGQVGRLIEADPSLNIVAVQHLPGVLVQDDPSVGEPDTYRQAGALLAAFHAQARRVSADYESAMDAKAMAWLEREHRIPRPVERRLREVLAGHDHPPAVLVPTHGDWQPRNWVIADGTVRAIDLGRADWRLALTDFVRMAGAEWRDRPDLEAAFLDGYGDDPREPAAWQRALVREAVGTAVWAHLVGDEEFEAHGHALIDRALA